MKQLIDKIINSDLYDIKNSLSLHYVMLFSNLENLTKILNKKYFYLEETNSVLYFKDIFDLSTYHPGKNINIEETYCAKYFIVDLSTNKFQEESINIREFFNIFSKLKLATEKQISIFNKFKFFF
jgi:hypothetical protein